MWAFYLPLFLFCGALSSFIQLLLRLVNVRLLLFVCFCRKHAHAPRPPTRPFQDQISPCIQKASTLQSRWNVERRTGVIISNPSTLCSLSWSLQSTKTCVLSKSKTSYPCKSRYKPCNHPKHGVNSTKTFLPAAFSEIVLFPLLVSYTNPTSICLKVTKW